jgi:F0F1-type ATP synthase assembly protein I
MEKTITTSTGRLAGAAGQNKNLPSKPVADQNAAFTAAAIGMSWQLAIIVLLPVIGGYKLDQANGTSPWWTLAGVTLGVIGSIFVIRRALTSFGAFSAGDTNHHDDTTPHGSGSAQS